jgi:hypothetical protein
MSEHDFQEKAGILFWHQMHSSSVDVCTFATEAFAAAYKIELHVDGMFTAGHITINDCQLLGLVLLTNGILCHL